MSVSTGYSVFAWGRFLSTDPLTAAYPELTPYQFASNSPIENIDLDGLEAFTVHGTYSDNTAFDKMSDEDLARLTGNEYQTPNKSFEWPKGTNSFTNGWADRQEAAEALATYVMSNKVEGEDITLVAHSHGGNVAIRAATIIRERLDEDETTRGTPIHLITLSTPAYNGKFHPEDPANAPLDSHLHFYSENDDIQMGGANAVAIPGRRNAGRTYTNDRTVNIKVDDTKPDSDEAQFGGIDSHSIQNRPDLLVVPNSNPQ